MFSYYISLLFKKYQKQEKTKSPALFFCTLAFTLIELMIVIAILATLTSIAVPNYFKMINRARITLTIVDLRNLGFAIDMHILDTGSLPVSLNDLDMQIGNDPWGNPYQYTNFSLTPKGKWRKDRFLVPINTTYDLYSMGPDGDSKPPFTAKASRDDIVRANDGAFIGLAQDY